MRAGGSRPGIPFPMVLLLGVTVVMTFIATRRRFGRYVYAYGGNPDAAELAGINTRWTIMKTYILMGVLCAIAAAISSARLNGSTLDVGPATSCTSSLPRSSAAPRSRAASGRSRAPSSGRFVMQSLAYGLASSACRRRGRTSSPASSSSSPSASTPTIAGAAR